MFKTFKISFRLRMTYRVNSILYGLKQIPLVKRILPDKLYQVQGLKIAACVLAAIGEVFQAFFGKLLYLLIMVLAPTGVMMSGIVGNFGDGDGAGLFLHIFLLLTVIGTELNAYLFDVGNDKYYALMLLRMDAKKYTLTNYAYALLKVLVGFGIFGTLFGSLMGLEKWQCMLMPFTVMSLKSAHEAIWLYRFEKKDSFRRKYDTARLVMLILGCLVAAYGLPFIGICLSVNQSIIIMVISVIVGILSIKKLICFNEYRQAYQLILAESRDAEVEMESLEKAASINSITNDVTITSQKKGLEFLNDLFVKRHKKILWRSSIRTSVVVAVILLLMQLLLWLAPEAVSGLNNVIHNSLPTLVFIMYVMNRGQSYTQSLFMNCDHALLTYSFYKIPGQILTLFWIRLREIIKVNLLPAMILGTGLTWLLYYSGGTDRVLEYLVMFLTVPMLSVFFSLHNLTMYYLLQPYNVATELKNPVYKAVAGITYVICYFMLQIDVKILGFGIGVLGFCTVYVIVASLLVYFFAPKTFRIRM